LNASSSKCGQGTLNLVGSSEDDPGVGEAGLVDGGEEEMEVGSLCF